MATGSTYNYRVVVNVDINARGANASPAENEFRKIEQQVLNSQKRITDYETQYARARYDAKIADYNRQLQATREFAQEEVAYEIKRNQQIAAERARFNQQRLLEQQATAQREIAIERAKTEQILSLQISANNARSASFNTAARTGQAGAGQATGAFSPSNITTQQQLYNQLLNTGLGNFGTGRGGGATAATPDFATAARGGLAPNAVSQINQTTQALNQMTAATNQNAGALSLWGRAFKGAFIGAVAGIVFSTIVGGIANIISAIKDAGVAAVQAAADFQETRNSLIVFAGSAEAANRELAAVDETARKTTGLRLVSAEQGYRQLRALGFEAENSRKLIEGLGKERLLSGATDQDVQRVIVNLTQLSAGSNRASQDIREIYHVMPSLRKEFALAFGTLQPKKIAEIFGKDPQEAIRKLTEQMEKTRGASSGLNNAFGKLEDAGTQIGRKFGEPILDPITTAIQNLTTYLDENGNSWTRWGQKVGDTIEGLSSFFSGAQATNIPSPFSGAGRVVTAIGTAGASEFYRLLFNTTIGATSDYGATLRQQRTQKSQVEQEKALQEWVSRQLTQKAQTDLIPNQYGSVLSLDINTPNVRSFGKYGSFDVNEMRRKFYQDEKRRATEGLTNDELNQEVQAIQKAEKVRQDDLAKIDSYYKQAQSIRESALNIEVARNQENVNKVHDLTQKDFKAQEAEIKDFYAKKIALQDGDTTEIYKLQVEENNALRDLNSKAAIEQINFEREQAKQRREDLIEFYHTEQQVVEDSFARRAKTIERELDFGQIETSKGYDELIQLTTDRENILSEKIRSEYALRLQDKSLTDQQVVNLEKQRDLEIQRLQDESLDRTLEIEDKKREAIIKNITYQREVARTTYEYLSGLANSFQKDFFNTATFSSTAFKNFQEFVLKRSQRKDLQGQIDVGTGQSQAIAKQLADLRSKYPADADIRTLEEPFIKATEKAETSLAKLRIQLKGIEDAIPANYEKFEKLADQIGLTADAVDNLNSAMLQHRQSLDLADAQAEVDYWQNIKDVTKDVDRQREASLRLQQAQNRLSRLDYDQSVEKAEQYRNSLKGINEEIALLENRDTKKIGGLADIFNKGQRQEVRSILEQIVVLEMQLASPDITAEYRIRAAALEHIVELRNKEVDAIIRANNARIDFAQQFEYSQNRADADVLEFLASQKGVTEIFSEARINAITTAYDGLDRVAQSLAKNFGVASKAVEELISSLLKLGLNYIFRKFLGGSGGFSSGGDGQSGGGFNLGGIGIPTQGYGGFSFPQAGGNPFAAFGGATGQTYSQYGANRSILNTLGGQSGGFNFGALGGLGAFGGAGAQTLGGGISLVDVGIGNIGTNTHELLHQGTLGQIPSAAGLGKAGSILQGAGFALTGALIGSQFGRGSIGGSILGGIGGGLLGLVGGAFGSSSTAFGGLFGSLGGLLGISGAATLGIGAAIGGALLLGSYLFGRSSARRKDEKIRAQALTDALKQLDDIITNVKNDRLDGAQALTQAQAIRDKYVQDMGQLKTKKTRDIALKDVSQIDAKIAELQAAVTNQAGRKERLALSVPTFADGGTLSSFMLNNYKHNPLGYQQGGQAIGYFPEANRMASFNERGAEYILDAETTRNVGVNALDMMRATKGQSFKDMQRAVKFGGFADGGNAAPVFTNPVVTTGNGGNGGTGKMQVINQLHITLGVETVMEAIVELINQSNGSRQQITDITNFIKADGGAEFVQAVINKAKARKLI